MKFRPPVNSPNLLKMLIRPRALKQRCLANWLFGCVFARSHARYYHTRNVFFCSIVLRN